MRVIPFVLVLFISFLIVQPCADTDVHRYDEISMHKEDTHSHNSDSQDNCSAFCVCACCGTSMQMTSVFFYKSIQDDVILTESPFGYQSFYKSYSSSNIWDPPIL